MDDLEKQKGTSTILCQASFRSYGWIKTGIIVRKRSIRVIFVLCDLEILQMTSKNNMSPLLYYVKLCASFQSHRWIQTGVTVRKRSICVKISYFLSRVTLKFIGWPWKIIGHLFYTTFSFGHHFKTISEFNLSYSPETLNLGQNWLFFVPCDLGILIYDLEKQ